MINGKKVIVSMTSWTKRIQFVSRTIFMMEKQSVLPDLIILNLAKDEFVNKEQDLPDDLISLLDTLNNFNINWVKENTKAFKKVIPIIEKYKNEDCYILSVDDDWYYDTNYIKFMIETLDKNKGCYITPGTCGPQPHGYAMIYNPIWFKDNMLWSLTKKDMDKIIASDEWIWANLLKNGLKSKSVKDIEKYIITLNRGNCLGELYKNNLKERRTYIRSLIKNFYE